jgi:hypothetical protein
VNVKGFLLPDGPSPEPRRIGKIVAEVGREDIPPIVVAEMDLQPTGVAAILRYKDASPLGTFFHVSRTSFNDRALERVIGYYQSLTVLERLGENVEPQTLTLFSDGRMIHEKQSGARFEQQMQASPVSIEARLRDDSESDGTMTKRVLDMARSSPIVNVPGIGDARVVRYGKFLV